MVPGIASRASWSWSALVASLWLPLASRLPACESFAVRPTCSSARTAAAGAFESFHVHDACHARQPRVLGSTKRLEVPRARAWAPGSRCGRMMLGIANCVHTQPCGSYDANCCCCRWSVTMGKALVCLLVRFYRYPIIVYALYRVDSHLQYC